MLELCSIASGSSGNCICVGSDDSHVLIDAGISGKKIENGLNAIDLKSQDMQGILVTHEHIDHIAGLGVMARRYGLPLYATPGTIDAIKNVKSVGKIDESLFHPITPMEEFSIGDLEITPIPISHDAAEPVAYRIKKDHHIFAVVTDLGTYDDAIIQELQGLEVLLLEANHDIHMLETGVYPYSLKRRIMGDRGHLSNERSGQLLGELLHDKFGTVMLGHLSKENNYEELAYEAVRLEVTSGDNPYKADDFPLVVHEAGFPARKCNGFLQIHVHQLIIPFRNLLRNVQLQRIAGIVMHHQFPVSRHKALIVIHAYTGACAVAECADGMTVAHGLNAFAARHLQ